MAASLVMKKSRKCCLGQNLENFNQYLYRLEGEEDLSGMLHACIEDDCEEDDLTKLLRWCMEPRKCSSVDGEDDKETVEDEDENGSLDRKSVPDSLLHKSKQATFDLEPEPEPDSLRKKFNQYLYKLDGEDFSEMLQCCIENNSNEDDLSKLLRWCMEPQKSPSVGEDVQETVDDQDRQEGSFNQDSVESSLLCKSKQASFDLDLDSHNEKHQRFLSSLQDKFNRHILTYEDDGDEEDLSKVLPLLCTDDQDLSNLFTWCTEPPPYEATTKIMDDRTSKTSASRKRELDDDYHPNKRVKINHENELQFSFYQCV